MAMAMALLLRSTRSVGGGVDGRMEASGGRNGRHFT
jgi:hypothetical protein